MVRNLTEPSLSKIQRQVYKTRYAGLVQKYEALNEQYDDCLDDGMKVILQSKIERMKAELDELEGRLKQGEPPNLQEKLHYIDFRDAVKSFRALLDCSGKEGGVSFFVVPNSRNMAGELLMKRLKEELKNDANLTPCPVRFSGCIELNEIGLLREISRYFGVESNVSDLDGLLDDVVERICASVQTRSIVLLEISEWHRLPIQEQVFSWLCDDFYSRLDSKFFRSVSSKWRRVHIFVVIISDEFISDECLRVTRPLSSISQNNAIARGERIFNIALENWSQEDIENWLEFTGLPDGSLENAASRLYTRSVSGIPLLVQDALERDFCD
jgi:hypothetical protein